MTTIDDKMRIWSQAPSITESDRIDRTERAIKESILLSSDPRVKEAKVFAKGSVKAKTNIRNGSDIDIVVMPKNIFIADYPENFAHTDFGNQLISYSYDDFRRGVRQAIVDKFGGTEVTEGNKAVRIRGTFSGSRIDADVIPAFEHRRYINPNNTDVFHEGIAFFTKNDSKKIINWPHHNFDNTIAKHESTGRRYRKVIRVLKNVRREMQDQGIDAAQDIASFLIESLAWNAPDHLYSQWTLGTDVFNVLDHTISATYTQEGCDEWGEVNELKYLFKGSQKWTRQQAHSYLVATKYYLEAI